MKIRETRRSDKEIIDKIYTDFYSKNEYPEFFNEDGKFQCPFVVTDDNDRIIVAGGVKTIVEAVFVTDKNIPPLVRLDALFQGLGSVIFIAKGMKYQQIHAFVNNDESYTKILQKYGFKLIDAKLLVLDIGEPNG